ncbi:MAG TPA: tRNA (N(6)-L-threonylcarbamoyladenosine(37)-C(2))-methylthiotransferase MtaB, partial [Ruminococcaceae bacterium]|nr:tRNA (N(6)-L-threonylcarbamoyladenosine(37)-C(2))-methylthiotransferase MtaB [Oscillospiraceae bacterium]
MKVKIITLGCKVNQYESQYMMKSLVSSGFSLSEDCGQSDVVIVNSCTVTATSDKKVR